MELLTAGTTAPDFTVNDQNGNPVTLSSFRGKKVILYFYPKDDTPGCTKEACNFRDNFSLLQKKGYVILGVSVDSEKSHQKFIKKFDLPFPLLADTEKEIVTAYGVWGLKKFMGREFMGIHRVTYVIDKAGKVEHVIEKVDTENSTEQILALQDK